jgi:drug/metabolite transporter (DMT)-like permease
VSVVLALLASLTWGTADFLGGTAARRLPAAVVVVASQAIALVGVLVVAAAMGAFADDPGYAGWAVAAGCCGAIALTAFYAALAAGTMGVVAPIAALGVALPVVVGVAQGDRPSPAQAAGIVIAVVGMVLASGPELSGGRAARRPLLLAAVAGAGFGAVNVLLAHGARSSTVMSLLVMRVASVTLVLALVVRGPARARVRPRPADLPLLVGTGAGDIGANAMFAVASTRGLLSVVSVLSSLYPAVTVALARWVHAERLRPVQLAGVAAALVGVALIASGGGAA